MHKACGKQVINWVFDTVEKVGFSETIVIVGHGADQVKECLGDKYKYVLQKNSWAQVMQ